MHNDGAPPGGRRKRRVLAHVGVHDQPVDFGILVFAVVLGCDRVEGRPARGRGATEGSRGPLLTSATRPHPAQIDITSAASSSPVTVGRLLHDDAATSLTQESDPGAWEDLASERSAQTRNRRVAGRRPEILWRGSRDLGQIRDRIDAGGFDRFDQAVENRHDLGASRRLRSEVLRQPSTGPRIPRSVGLLSSQISGWSSNGVSRSQIPSVYLIARRGWSSSAQSRGVSMSSSSRSRCTTG